MACQRKSPPNKMKITGLCVAMIFALGSSAAQALAETRNGATDEAQRPATTKQQLPDSRVRLPLPSGFEPARNFRGFIHTSGASIVIIEVAGSAYDRMANSLTARLLSSRGVRDAKPLDLGRSDRHVAIAGRQATTGGWFQKLMLALGDARSTALITANLPEVALRSGLISRTAVVDALRRAELGPPTPPRSLPFRLGRGSNLKYAGSIKGTGYIFTETGMMPRAADADANEANRANGARETTPAGMMIVSEIVRPAVPERQREPVATGLLMQLSAFTDTLVQRRERVLINGLAAVQLEAGAVARAGGQSVALHQTTVFTGRGRLYRLLGIAPADRRRELFADFDEAARGFRVTR